MSAHQTAVTFNPIGTGFITGSLLPNKAHTHMPDKACQPFFFPPHHSDIIYDRRIAKYEITVLSCTLHHSLCSCPQTEVSKQTIGQLEACYDVTTLKDSGERFQTDRPVRLCVGACT